jgi:antitoxin ParD1/3/4
MSTVTISLPESLKTFVEDQVARKGYGNVSEYFRTLLREAQAREADAKLEALLLEGLGSGDAVPADKRFWKELRSEAARLMAEPAPRKRSP